MNIWKQLWSYTKKYKKYLFYSLSALMISTTVFIVGTLITKTVIDKYIMGIFKPLSVNETVKFSEH